MYKFKSKCLILQNVPQPPSAPIANISLTPLYLWNHQLELEEEQEKGSSALLGGDIWFCNMKEGLDKLTNLSLSFSIPKCSRDLIFPTFQSGAHLWCQQTAHKPSWHLVTVLLSWGHGAKEVQWCVSGAWKMLTIRIEVRKSELCWPSTEHPWVG